MSRLLLDTHTFIWFAFGSPQLSATARREIEQAESQPLISIASLWELTIKAGLGKLTIGPDVLTFFEEESRRNGISVLPIETAHLRALQNLPLHHRDSFDRPLIAQSIAEQAPFVSGDSNLDAYTGSGLIRIW